MRFRYLFLLLTLFRGFNAFSQAKPASVKLSEINIPIIINLRPIYQMAENKVDTVFSSPNYPKDWVQTDCATRYKYHFRRSPLRLLARGNNLQLGFTGFYRIVGSTRGCVGTTVLTPWTPECSCGFNEPERRVEVGFNSSFQLTTDHRLLTTIVRTEPKALDKCSVCFWGQDVTNTVMDGLKAELDAAKKAITDSFGVVNLRPWMQQAWNKLNETYPVPNAGFLNLHPQQIRMEQLKAQNDELHISIGISAAPAVSFVPVNNPATPLPNLSAPTGNDGFQINLEAALQYDSLSRVLNGFLQGKRFDISEGLIAKHVVVQQTKVAADTSGHLLIRVDFGGSFNGTAYFTGKPVYDAGSRTIYVADLAYELKTKNFLLNTAKWLFNSKIVSELKKHTVFPLTNYYDTARVALNEWLNKEWTKGIRGEGSVSEISLNAVQALPQHLLIQSQCNGKLVVRVSEINL